MMRQLNIRIDEKTYEKLKRQSKTQRISMNRLVDHFVSEGIKTPNILKRVLGQ
tara:strand:+ start:1064 stop:1222 length:159 start_codon:yes stop_codon:yes gene_type:complete